MAHLVLLFLCISLFQTACSNKVETPEPLLWINGTHAVLTESNGGDIYLFGTLKHSSANRAMIRNTLENWWDVTTKQELDDVIDSLAEGRHNPTFLGEAEAYGITDMSREEFEHELRSIDDREIVMYFRNMFDAYQEFGEKAIMGWDLSRATQLCAYGYIADFYSYDEAAEKSLAIGRLIQSNFGSWDDFYTSYFYGYAYWSDDDIEDPQSEYAKRVTIFNKLQEDSKSPLKLDWNLNLSR